MEINDIFWDFDGVILSSHSIRKKGFRVALSNYPKEQVNKLLEFHEKNGGWSRYVKFEYFFKHIRKELFSKKDVNDLAEKYSSFVKPLLIRKELLINESIDFIKSKGNNYRMYIASGSDGNELKEICDGLGISSYFISINGSPETKTSILKRIIYEQQLEACKCLMIGDTKNDFDAAFENNMFFLGFNNVEIEKLTNVNYTLSSL
jgi:HAD superfamily hydrolase (TIGR01549 family)